MPPTADGSRQGTKIMSEVRKMKNKAHANPGYIKFNCLVNNYFDEIMAHNDVVDLETAWCWPIRSLHSVPVPH